MKIAIIGGGISGIVAAHRLQCDHEVTIFEASPQLGGHAHGVEVEPGVFADTGVIIFNQGSYPEFCQFLRELGVYEECFRMEMSLCFSNLTSGRAFALGKRKLPLCGGIASLINPKTLRSLRELHRFYKEGKSYLEEVRGSGLALGELLDKKKFSTLFQNELLFPLAMAVWSLPRGYFRTIEAELFLNFLDHHRCLGGDLENFRWYTFGGSTRLYIDRFKELFTGTVVLNSQVKAIVDKGNGIELRLGSEGRLESFDHVIIATHADAALALLQDPTEQEQLALGSWKYHKTKLYLHSDESFAPRPLLRSSWNIFFGDSPEHEWITYDINRIQRLNVEKNYFVTLTNSRKPLHVVKELEFSHPIFDHTTVKKHLALEALNRGGRRSFCGSYFGYGFHEDAIRSANAVTRRLFRKEHTRI